MTPREMATAERLELADLLDTLTPEQWAAPSLCAGWSVRDVAVHVVSFEGLGPRALATELVAGRSVGGTNERRIRAFDEVPDADVPALVRSRSVPHGLTRGFGSRIAVTDALIHQQDVRRALALPREVEADRLRVALPFAYLAPVVGGAWTTRGLRLVAEDVGWSTGRGDEVRGRGEAVLMAMAGRGDALPDLTGPGVDRLARRLG